MDLAVAKGGTWGLVAKANSEYSRGRFGYNFHSQTPQVITGSARVDCLPQSFSKVFTTNVSNGFHGTRMMIYLTVVDCFVMMPWPSAFLLLLALNAVARVIDEDSLNPLPNMEIMASGIGINSTTTKLVYGERLDDGRIYAGFLDESLPFLELDSETFEKQESQGPGCGVNFVGCNFEKNRAFTDVCRRLMNRMAKDARRKVSVYISAYCILEPGSKTCCTTWSQNIKNLRVGYLNNAASKIIDRCDRDQMVSGFAEEVELARTCCRQCITSRLGVPCEEQ